MDGAEIEFEIQMEMNFYAEGNINYSEVALYAANQIILTQSTDIDNVAGATHTIEGIKDAVLYALKEAKE